MQSWIPEKKPVWVTTAPHLMCTHGLGHGLMWPLTSDTPIREQFFRQILTNSKWAIYLAFIKPVPSFLTSLHFSSHCEKILDPVGLHIMAASYLHSCCKSLWMLKWNFQTWLSLWHNFFYSSQPLSFLSLHQHHYRVRENKSSLWITKTKPHCLRTDGRTAFTGCSKTVWILLE